MSTSNLPIEAILGEICQPIPFTHWLEARVVREVGEGKSINDAQEETRLEWLALYLRTHIPAGHGVVRVEGMENPERGYAWLNVTGADGRLVMVDAPSWIGYVPSRHDRTWRKTPCNAEIMALVVRHFTPSMESNHGEGRQFPIVD